MCLRNIEGIANLHKRETRLETLLRVLGNSNEYKKIRKAAEEKVTSISSKRRDLPKMAVFESIIREPDKFSFLVSNRFYNGGHYAASKPCIGVYRALILVRPRRSLS